MAIEDAVCLTGELEKAAGDFARAFRAYNDVRYLRTGQVQLMARLYGEVCHASGVAREVRNRILSERTPHFGMKRIGATEFSAAFLKARWLPPSLGPAIGASQPGVAAAALGRRLHPSVVRR